MSDIQCQQALDRVLTYLQDDGQALTPGTCRKALRLVDEAIEQDPGPNLPARCMDRLPEYFNPADPEIPLPNPPLDRGHVRYFSDSPSTPDGSR